MRELKITPPRARKMPDQLYVATVTYADDDSPNPVIILYGNDPRILNQMVTAYNTLLKLKQQKSIEAP